MSFIKCFDAALMVIEEASERFTPTKEPDPQKLHLFKQCCEGIDMLSKEFGGRSFEIEVDEETMDISVALECGEIIIETKEHIMYELAKTAKRFEFSQPEEDVMLAKFVFPSIW